MERIYHNFKEWECYHNGFYRSLSRKENKEDLIKEVITIFEDRNRTRKLMLSVINNWVISCEQFLTNKGNNRIAWLGQSACCYDNSIPEYITRSAWNQLDDDVRYDANKIAKEVLSIWDKKYKEVLESGKKTTK